MKKYLILLVLLFPVTVIGRVSIADKDAKKNRERQVSVSVEKPKYVRDKGFSNITLGVLGVFDVTNTKFGMETRVYIDNSYVFVPIEMQLMFGNSFRIRTWPEFFFKKRRSPKDSAGFLSLFTSSTVQSSPNDDSASEIGFGGGFTGGGFKIAAWLTSNFNQGTPTVQDIFAFRTRIRVTPNDFFYGVVGIRMGTAIARGTTVTTSSTTFDGELELGFSVSKLISIVGGVEIRTDNLGSLLNNDANVPGITDALSVLVKLGVLFKI